MKTVDINGKEYPVYATVEEADDYFAGFFNSGWEDIEQDDKPKLLVSATRSIDRGNYAGEKVECSQLLKFPRIIYHKQTCDKVLLEACCEEALAIYNWNSAADGNVSGIKSMRVQDTTIEFDGKQDTKQFKSENANKLLYPYFEFGVEIGYCANNNFTGFEKK